MRASHLCCKLIVWTIAVAFLLPAGAWASDSADPVVVRIGTVAPSGTPWSALLARSKKRIQSESNGKLKVKLYLGGKLGSETSLVRRCQKGQVSGIAVSNGASGAAVPERGCAKKTYSA